MSSVAESVDVVGTTQSIGLLAPPVAAALYDRYNIIIVHSSSGNLSTAAAK